MIPMRRASLVALPFLLALGAVAWWLHDRSGPETGDSQGSVASAPVPGSAAPAQPPVAPAWILRQVGLPRAANPSVTVLVDGDSVDWSTRWDPDAGVLHVVPPAVPDEASRVTLWVRHPRFVETEVHVPRPYEARITIEFMLRPATLLTGRVLGEDGFGADKALVAVFALDDGVPAGAPLAWDRTRGSQGFGRFRLELPDGGRVAMLAFGDPGSLTWDSSGADVSYDKLHGDQAQGVLLRILEVPAGGETDVGALTAPDGVLLSGHVRAGDGTPLPYVVVEAEPLADAPHRIELDGAAVRLVDGRAIPDPGQALTDGDGRFRFAGLPAGRYRLRVRGDYRVHPHPGALDAPEASAQVAAPADGVALTVPLATVGLTIVPPAPAPENIVAWLVPLGEEGERGSEVHWLPFDRVDATDENPVRWRLSPGARYRVHVKADGCVPWERVVVAPAQGGTAELEARLAARPPLPSVVLRFGDLTPYIEDVGVALFARGDAPGEDEPLRIAEAWAETWSDRVGFVLSDVEPGAYTLHARPGGAWPEAEGTWLPVLRDVEVRAGAPDVVLDLETARAGRLALRVVDEKGRPLAAACRVRDADGALVDSTFVQPTGTGGLARGRGTLPTAGSAFVRMEPALPPGRYTVDLSLAGWVPVTREVVIEAYERTPLEIVMRRAP